MALIKPILFCLIINGLVFGLATTIPQTYVIEKTKQFVPDFPTCKRIPIDELDATVYICGQVAKIYPQSRIEH